MFECALIMCSADVTLHVLLETVEAAILLMCREVDQRSVVQMVLGDVVGQFDIDSC